MLNELFRSRPAHPEGGLTFVRLAAAAILLVHPVSRLLHHTVPVFGEWLGTQGFPMGTAVAYAVTFTELASGVALLSRRLVVPACAALIAILGMGIKMVHGPEGWFVVGGGRNGMEYSVLLIACLAGVALAHWPRREVVI
ncbi:MAG TPA: DoxX family protein [Holophagaceae bacterium]|nr:DoxX family protein [Holophagaceae bacterium]